MMGAKMMTNREFAELLTPLGSSSTEPSSLSLRFCAAKMLSDLEAELLAFNHARAGDQKEAFSKADLPAEQIQFRH
jgi:hypothetical protein